MEYFFTWEESQALQQKINSQIAIQILLNKLGKEFYVFKQSEFRQGYYSFSLGLSTAPVKTRRLENMD